MQDMINRGATRAEMDHNKDRNEQLQEHHQKTLWIYWTLIILGVWVIMAPLTFDYHVGVVKPSGGREVWLTLEERINYLKLSDLVSGTLLVILGFRSLKANHPFSLWAACFLGVWLSFAPILFWAPTAIAYYNDTFVGMLVIALTVLIPGMPNMVRYMAMGTANPPGWSYNPSSWPQRWIMIVLGLLGWMVSRYLAAYQLGYIESVADPFFGESTRKVLDSSMSHSLPISDAGLGSLAYTFEFLMGFMGSPARWRTMPWMVTFFGILVIPLGLVHIFLVISQPVMVGFWCTYCLLAAMIMLPMIPLEADEVIAMVQFLRRKVRAGEGFWKIFWKGGSEEELGPEVPNKEVAPSLYSFSDQPSKILKSSLWGMNLPLGLGGATVLGLLVVILPVHLEAQKTYGDLLRVAGLLIVTFSVVAMGEPLRSMRFLNIILGVGFAGAGLFLDATGGILWVATILGIMVALFSLPKGPITHRFDTWDKWIK